MAVPHIEPRVHRRGSLAAPWYGPATTRRAHEHVPSADSRRSPVGTAGWSTRRPSAQLLQIALFTEDPAALDGVISELPTSGHRLVSPRRTAPSTTPHLPATLSPWTRARIVALTAGLEVHVRDAMVRAIARNDAWGQLVPVLDHIGVDDARSLLAVPALKEAEVRTGLAAAAAGHPAAERLVRSLAELSP